jgi:transposase-like protein
MIDREAIIAEAVNGETSNGIARRHGCTVKYWPIKYGQVYDHTG